MLSDTAKSRLQTLATFLFDLDARPVVRDHFEMYEWVAIDGDNTSLKFDLTHLDVENPCNTVACALGWAPSIPEFRAAGLRIYVPHSHAYTAVVEYLEYTGIDAAERFFDISTYIAGAIFIPNTYRILGKIQPIDVALRIQSILKYDGNLYAVEEDEYVCRNNSVAALEDLPDAFNHCDECPTPDKCVMGNTCYDKEPPAHDFSAWV